MGIWRRVRNVFRGDAVNGEITEEMETHVAEAVAAGRDEREARRAMGRVMRAREESHAMRVVGWMDSLRADVVFGWRQLWKRKVTTLAAVVSLGLAIGSCMAAFRLVDALFLRPLPIAHPERLYEVLRQGPSFRDGTMGEPQWSFEYPLFVQMRDAVKEQATVVGVSERTTNVTFGGVADAEKVQIAYVSGTMFGTFGLKPAVGRLLTESDDTAPGAGPYAVISYDYWVHRFGKDPNVIGRVMHVSDSADELGDSAYQIVGVGPKGFAGTQPGTQFDLYLPATMFLGVKNPHWSWIGAFVALKPGAAPAEVQQRVEAVFQAAQRENAKTFNGRGKQFLDRFLAWHTILKPEGAGFSLMQRDYRLPLTVLCVLVLMVLLIACANVANLMSAQSAARAREMALRVSIGSSRRRLVRLVMVESTMLGAAAVAAGLLLAWWAAPLVVRMISVPMHPVQLALTPDWLVVGFGAALALGVTLLLGTIPALRASHVRPVSALKGGEEPAQRQRTMYALIVAQVAFCFVVLFVSGLFVRTFERLQHRTLGFRADGLVVIDTSTAQPVPDVAWQETAEMLRRVPGVQEVGLSLSALLSGNSFGNFITVNGVKNPELALYMPIAPDWMSAMHIPLLEGRNLRARDLEPGTPDVALVSRKFALDYFGSAHAVGRTFLQAGIKTPTEVVGVVGDVRYQSMREQDAPVFYTAYRNVDEKGQPRPMPSGTFSVRVSGGDSGAMGETLRRMVLAAHPEFRIQSVRTEEELIAAQTVKERMLAALAGFFAVVALLLAAVGLYGVLHYSVVQREREIGIRIALGAAAGNIARIVTARVFLMVLVGAGVGLAAGVGSARFVATLLFGVTGTDVSMMALPAAVLLGAAVLAAAPAVLRAVKIDPAVMLRAE